MKRYIRDTTSMNETPILSSVTFESIDSLTESEMLKICNSYRDSEGNYGSFDSSDELDKFGVIWLRLRRAGYNV